MPAVKPILTPPSGQRLLDDAFELLRAAPWEWLAFHAIGTVPFVLALLAFCADMSRSPFAAANCAPAAAGLAATFLWMKLWQGVFAGHLRSLLTGAETPRWNWRRWARILSVQALLQPFSLLLLLLGGFLLLPAPWCHAFHQGLTLEGNGGRGIRETVRAAARVAWVAPRQNVVVFMLTSLFFLLLLVNVGVLLAMLPYAAKWLTGADNDFTRAGTMAVFNGTFLVSTMGVAYLLMDPLVKATATLRQFHARAGEDGADLSLSLRRFRASHPLLAALFLLALLALPASGWAQAEAPDGATPPATSVTGAGWELDTAIRDTLRDPEFAWRIPREWELPDLEPWQVEEPSWLQRFHNTLSRWWTGFTDWLKKWLNPEVKNKQPRGDRFHLDWQLVNHLLLFTLLAAVLSLLAVLLMRFWRRRRMKPVVAVATAVAVAEPDLTAEEVTADQLPVDGWRELAERYAAAGEWRLSLRAWYLSGLALLAERRLLRLDRAKSNREYVRELQSRSLGTGADTFFAANSRLFDGTWYGCQPATPELLQQFTANLREIAHRVDPANAT